MGDPRCCGPAGARGDGAFLRSPIRPEAAMRMGRVHPPSTVARLGADSPAAIKRGCRPTTPTTWSFVAMVIACLLATGCAGARNWTANGTKDLLGPGTFEGSLRAGGLDRTYRIHIPPSYDGHTAV